MFKCRAPILFLIALLSGMTPITSRGADGDPPPKPDQRAAEPKPETPEEALAKLTVPLQITPAADAHPILKHRLYFRPIEQEPGNAAPLYLKAALLLSEQKRDERYWEAVDTWLMTTVSDLPREEVPSAVARYEGILRLVRMAARHEECRWDLQVRQGFYDVLLPELTHIRSFGRLLALQARWQIASQDFDGAIETLRTGFTLARHVAAGPTLIHGLMGVAISRQMLEQVAAFSEAPGSPNLYWPLTALPQPFVDLRKAADLESDGVLFTFPQLQNLGHAVLSKEQWDARLQAFVSRYATMEPYFPTPAENANGPQLTTTVRLIAGFPKARKWMIDSGERGEVVDKKPSSEIVLKYIAFVYEDLGDDTFRWFYLPYSEAREGMLAAEQRLKEGQDREIVPFASMLIPAVNNVMRTAAKFDREMAARRCVEALRMFAAAHDGKLPEKLAEIKDAPIPGDPVIGKPFEYRLEDGHALLIGPPPDGKSWEIEGLRYEIRVKK